jgi:selenium-binding protein 1
MDGTSYSRRQVLAGGLVGLGALVAESSLGRLRRGAFAAEACATGSAGPGWASPREAIKAPREQFLYTSCIYWGTGVDQPDFLGVVDVHPESDTYGKIAHRTSMPYVGDELHHFGWQTCSSSNGTCGLERRHRIVPGFRSSRVHILDVKSDPRCPQIAKVIEPKEIIKMTGYSRPHTVHCLPGGIVVMSMMGDAEGNAPGGLAALDAKTFDVLGRWEKEKGPQALMYDFWYQPQHNVMVTGEFTAPSVYEGGFQLDDVKAGRYGQRLHVWDLKKCSHVQTIDFGAEGLVPLESAACTIWQRPAATSPQRSPAPSGTGGRWGAPGPLRE